MDVKAFIVATDLDMILCRCRIWIEDSNGHRIAGNKKYIDCTDYPDDYEFIYFPNQTYTVHAKVEGSFEKKKARGPFNENTCFSIFGDVDDWTFKQTSC
ncbi:uncharacterized protein OCT59_023563 [Rhizophagus irregularis]|uniref:Uncharacterized protein n=3 Tax=Rhizophagus irregularis TaxID=588596 RepID=A0A2I1FAG2_9GLOM|nr:hypothetical protein GLOIN_2v1763956 [Rhizophagus irregularis DAOM 181602=DAOM 197198]PKK62063.1 hypothetical protein RhiirC2_790921 [Rhizophagus irregularis]PKY31372.1 hypothetical protein RhiirB3_448945 [Rhizophagus irregularis]POG80995.1 hypothetical protein GLOIN_2v1763956 [Rhizophagus irregularis DAOM 181602=DAOM 197198]UZO03151.1 hypothetical protein OCT59_023563 [Rhizophagus irregularis]CAB4474006.1 unnamed protein product [Rhizophagus irregularis]|eukprot:XP_025187861.1 hypothetical protein GLOIN_2v1763956 [Rhizophagus irregularis DAOM 181602=DAOM 197198]